VPAVARSPQAWWPFLGVFGFLAARFDYPAVLDGNAAKVLPNLLATGAPGRAVWAI
jgi:hypothetical protein